MVLLKLFVCLGLIQTIPLPETDSHLRKTADSLYLKADEHFGQMDTLATFKDLEAALKIYTDIHDSTSQSNVLNDFGYYHYYLGNYDQSASFYNRALVIDKLQNDVKKIVGRLKNLGIVHQQKGLHVNALNYYLEALQLARQHKQEESIASINNSIATLYREQEQFDKSMYHLRIALVHWQSLGDSVRMAYAYNNIGTSFFKQEQYDSALHYYFHSLDLKTTLKEDFVQASTLHNIGSTYLVMDSLQKAERYLSEAIQMEGKANSKQELAETYNALAELYIKREDYKRAQASLDSSRSYHVQTKARSIRLKYFQLQALVHEKRNELASSLYFYKQWAALRDSLFNEDKLKVLKIQSDYELGEKEKERQLADQKAALVEYENKQQRLIIASVAIIALLLLFLASVFWKDRRTIRDKNRQLDRKNKIIEILNGDIRHRTHNGLERVGLLLRYLYDDLEDEASKLQVKRAENMVLALSSLEEMLYDLDREHDILILPYFQKMLDRLITSHTVQEVQHELNVDPSLAFSIDKLVPLALIAAELITNAMKHAFVGVSHPKIWVSMQAKGPLIQLLVRDNGIGFSNTTTSRGFGHQLIHRFVEHLQGTLQSDYKEGTEFLLTFENKTQSHIGI